MPPLEQTLAPAQEGELLELDEHWSFVGRRKRQRWVWLALCRPNRNSMDTQARNGQLDRFAGTQFDPIIVVELTLFQAA